MAQVFLTPSVATFLAQVNANAAPPDYSPAAQREGLDGAMAQLGWPMPGDAPAAEVIELASGAHVHLFRPIDAGDAPLPLVVYTHGGSFFAGGAKSHGPTAATLASRTRAIVALVDYRLAPEAKAPAALDDCVAGVREVVGRADALGIDRGRIAIVGDSAGGSLAAGTALALRGEVAARLLVLINPMTTPDAAADASMHEFATGYFAGARDFAEGWKAYGGNGEGGRFHDLLAEEDLSGLPTTIVFTNEADPVRDQGERFAERLSVAGVVVLSLRIRGLTHAAWLFPRALPEAHTLFSAVAGPIRVALAE
jgi:acetyl esterase